MKNGRLRQHVHHRRFVRSRTWGHGIGNLDRSGRARPDDQRDGVRSSIQIAPTVPTMPRQLAIALPATSSSAWRRWPSRNTSPSRPKSSRRSKWLGSYRRRAFDRRRVRRGQHHVWRRGLAAREIGTLRPGLQSADYSVFVFARVARAVPDRRHWDGCLGLPLNGLSTGTANWATFSELAFTFRFGPGAGTGHSAGGGGRNAGWAFPRSARRG